LFAGHQTQALARLLRQKWLESRANTGFSLIFAGTVSFRNEAASRY